ncbi:hypothetical protein ACI6Q2_12240 [Chitinophagaceae bacterium LWZ2-11]
MKTFIFLLFFTAICITSYADGYWLEVSGKHRINDSVTVKVCYGGVNDSSGRYYKTADQLNKLKGFAVWGIDPKGVRFQIPIHQTNDCWVGSFKASYEGYYQILGIHESLPVVKRAEGTGADIRPIQYLRSFYAVGNAPADSFFSSGQFADMKVLAENKQVNIQVFFKQLPAPRDTKLRIFNPENWEKLPVTDKEGNAFFIPTMKGLYIIRADYYDNTPGSVNGDPYSGTRHRFDFSFQSDPLIDQSK